ncbi:hypothetical protein AB833_32115 [Chromatiales bacterium (ex Bugula neritina AB1)]|nr:hypothetical protein AB833_32115 [Chromatiales bacterium (ex Bugula neritina AB1)]
MTVARQLAVCCCQQPGDLSFREIADNFNFTNQGSVSGAITTMKRHLKNGELTGDYRKLERLLDMVSK